MRKKIHNLHTESYVDADGNVTKSRKPGCGKGNQFMRSGLEIIVIKLRRLFYNRIEFIFEETSYAWKGNKKGGFTYFAG